MAEAYRQPGHPVGSVTWGGGTHATLLGDGRWFVTRRGVRDEQFEFILGEKFRGEDSHPSVHFGQTILPRVAEMFGGTYVFNPPKPATNVVH